MYLLRSREASMFAYCLNSLKIRPREMYATRGRFGMTGKKHNVKTMHACIIKFYI